ncbi:hypothetical protein DL768_009684 [Monosporascus sp. mg162]|nr:hypothetical protein DL768_009684 [Monosporascus sp. mg162]
MLAALLLVTGPLLVIFATTGTITAVQDSLQKLLGEGDRDKFKCDLPSVVTPKDAGLPRVPGGLSSEDALLKQVERHAAIVRIPTISYDDNGEPGEDPRWDVFYELHRTLAYLYPHVHHRMVREWVNSVGLVYTLRGANPSLKPLLLTAHQDVVPVDGDSAWTYPPFSGHFDGRWLWGRGASDNKNSLTALMSALETLLGYAEWVPKRTIVLALGFDEESSGRRGAGAIGPFLENRYRKYGMAMLLDEGGMGLELLSNDTLYALPAVTEKGYIDIWFELHVNGGHSSTPFPHTGVGIVSEIVNLLESHPWEPKLIEGSPIHNHLVCQARYSPEASPKITKLVQKGDLGALTEELVTIDRATQYRIQTSQSADYFTGGVKINAMPEYVKLGVNHRVAPHNSIPEVKAKILKQIGPVVKKYRLTVKAFEGEDHNPEFRLDMNSGGDAAMPTYEVDYNGTLILSSSQATLNAPVSPTSGPVWDLFAGTIRHSFAFDGGKVIPVGELMTGNTDTLHYLNLTRHIYRWTPTRKGASLNAHTVDERLDMHAHMEALRFYYDLIRNFDASDIAPVEEEDGMGQL